MEESSLTLKKEQPISKQKLDLKFSELKEITYCFLLKESFFFIFNNILHRIPILLCSIFLKIMGQEQYIGINDFSFLMLDLISCSLRDFQEIITVVCGPFYSKGNYHQYRLHRNRLIFLGFIGYLLFLFTIPFLRNAFLLVGVEEAYLENVVKVGKFYILCYAPFMAISNFLKGIF